MRRQRSAHGLHATTARHLFMERDAAGNTFAERWLASGSAGLSNDERALFQCKMQMRVALLEIHRVIDDVQFEAVDLLDTQPVTLRIVDRTAAATALRFQTMLSWVYPMPHFFRLSGTGIGLDDVVPLPAREVVEECIGHLGGSGDTPERAYWLARHFERMADAIHATARQRRQMMFQAMDGTSGSSTYEIVGSFEECETTVAGAPSVVAEKPNREDAAKGFTAAFVCLDSSRNSPALPGNRILGRVVLGPKELRIDAIGGAALDEMRRRIESLLGPRIRFSRERRDDWAGQMLAKEPPFDASLVPPRLLENPPRVEYSTSNLPEMPSGVSRAEFQSTLLHDQHLRLLDEPIPALRGLTPRQASREPTVRPELLEWMKGLIRQVDKTNLETGRGDDVNWMIAELGLTELDFPAPPARSRPEGKDSEAGADDDFDFDGEMEGLPDLFEDADPEEVEALSRRVNDWSAPPLPDGPMSVKEAEMRLEGVASAFATPLAAVAELMQLHPDVITLAQAICRDYVGPEDSAGLVLSVADVWFAMVPRERSLSLRVDEVKEAFQAELEVLQRSGAREAPKMLLKGCPHPNLLKPVLGGIAFETQDPSSPFPAMSPSAVLYGMLMVKVLIAELDRALRAK